MNVKEIWSEADFEEMGWHDSHIHTISFPNENLEFYLDIDYLFKWVLDDTSNKFSFWVSPCILLFFNVLDLKISIEYQNTIGLNITDINRHNPRLSPNGFTTLWDFKIATDKGFINFKSSGYKQVVKKQPVFSQSQILSRVKW